MFVTSGAVLDVVKLKRCFMGVTNVLEHINGYMCHRTRLGNWLCHSVCSWLGKWCHH